MAHTSHLVEDGHLDYAPITHFHLPVFSAIDWGIIVYSRFMLSEGYGSDGSERPHDRSMTRRNIALPSVNATPSYFSSPTVSHLEIILAHLPYYFPSLCTCTTFLPRLLPLFRYLFSLTLSMCSLSWPEAVYTPLVRICKTLVLPSMVPVGFLGFRKLRA